MPVRHAYAHSLPGEPLERWETLPCHHAAVADLAAAFAEPFGFGAWAHLAGWLHDIGKLSPEFQAYIRKELSSGGDHSSAGACIALDGYPAMPGKVLAAIIAAHHAGLADGIDLRGRLDGAKALVPPMWGEMTGPLPALQALAPTRPFKKLEGPRGFSNSFLTRMLFSCLVDADFIATEAFYAAAEKTPVERGGHSPLAMLRERLGAYMTKKAAEAAPTPLNTLRADILRHAMQKAALPPGLFTLTVPTGGGKTLASLSFALDHALQHGLRRVIYVIPYTSIIEQTSDVFREALGSGDDILEHHASFDWDLARQKKRADDEAPDALSKLQRAAENWDVPIVVTTAVQLFESLFANRTSRCRKLHNIAQSVVILDEVQTLPVKLLLPSMAALDELARNYRTSIVLCTATQPALRKVDDAIRNKLKQPMGFAIDDERELAPDPKDLYRRLQRVRVEWRIDPVGDAKIAARFAEQPQMLCIVNKRLHAQALFEAIGALPGRTHLSTFMCARHRRLVLAELREKLIAGEPVRLVATSLIEAGVDIDFPEVWRAATGIDSIAQAAGRCNRSGLLRNDAGDLIHGRVVVFEPAEHTSQHEMTIRWQAAQEPFRQHEDPLGLDAVKLYFQRLYTQIGGEQDALDHAKVGGQIGILPAIGERAADMDFPFASIADAYRMIDDAMTAVVVPWQADAADDDAEQLLARMERSEKPAARDLRRLQQYVVQIPRQARDDWFARGVLRPVHPALGEAMLRFGDTSHYRPETGVDIAQSTYREAAKNLF